MNANPGEVSAWQSKRNALAAKFDRQFTTEDARVRLNRPFPTIVGSLYTEAQGSVAIREDSIPNTDQDCSHQLLLVITHFQSGCDSAVRVFNSGLIYFKKSRMRVISLRAVLILFLLLEKLLVLSFVFSVDTQSLQNSVLIFSGSALPFCASAFAIFTFLRILQRL